MSRYINLVLIVGAYVRGVLVYWHAIYIGQKHCCVQHSSQFNFQMKMYNT